MKEKLSFTLDKELIDAVRKYATEDDRPISISAAMAIIVKAGLDAKGVAIGDGATSQKRKRAE